MFFITLDDNIYGIHSQKVNIFYNLPTMDTCLQQPLFWFREVLFY